MNPNEPAFREPWEAQAFAMTMALHERGLFSWAEWTEALTQQIVRAQANGDPDEGNTYYHHWLAALEQLVATKAGSSPNELLRYGQAWRRAAERTPHGQPIELQPSDLDP